MKKLFKIKFTIDTGYDYPNYECIIEEEDKESAIVVLFMWIEPQLLGECHIVDYSVEEIERNEDNPIIYHNFNNPLKKG